MTKKLSFAAVAALLLSAVGAAHAASMDIGQITMTNITDLNGVMTGGTTAPQNINVSGGALNGYSIFNGNFSFTANFNTVTNAFTSGSFNLTPGTLLTPGLTPVEAASLSGTLTGLSQTGPVLDFTFNTTAGDPVLLSNFGNYGIFQLTLKGAPGTFNLGGSFAATGVSTGDLTAVPTPTAVSAGLLLMGSMAAFGARRSLKMG
jgi:hypothetical protein